MNFGQLLRFIAFSALLVLLGSRNASANVIDAIDIARVDGQAQVTIRFTTEIQYLRHGPEDEGKLLRIFVRVTKAGFLEQEVMQETVRSPKSDLIPRFSVIYPELVNGMLITFEKPTRYIVRPADDNRSIVIMIPLPPEAKKPASAPPAEKKPPQAAAPRLPEPQAVPAQPPAPVEQPALPATPPDGAAAMDKTQLMADAFIAEARSAFTAGDYPKAINRLNRVLGLPANPHTEAAQALIGEVREQNGEIAKARAEYELFLKLYPNSPEASRIKSRLAGLPSADVVRRTAAKRPRDDRPAEWQVSGGVSTYYFSGRSQVDSGPMNQDQKSLVSSAYANARLRDAVSDTRLVFRDTDYRNFLQSSRDYNRVYAAYAERTDRDAGYFIRVGRQNPNGAGVLERFDGINAGYNVFDNWRINGVYGQAVEFNSPYNKEFYGGSIEYQAQLGRPGASLYLIEQTLDGYLNRRAVGSEIRYFDGQFNGYGTLDYDTVYKKMNIAAFQGNYLDKWNNNYFFSYDYRASPAYSLPNALNSLSGMSYANVGDMVNTIGLGQARQVVADGTPVSTMLATGVTVPLTENWQVGADYRMSSISGANAVIPLNQICKDFSDAPPFQDDPLCVGSVSVKSIGICQDGTYDPATKTCRAGQAASGRTQMYSVQAIGTNLLTPNSVGVVNASQINGPDYTGHNIGLNYIFPFALNWRFEGNLRYFSQRSTNNSQFTDFSPSLKLGRQIGTGLFIEAEVGYNDSKRTGTTQSQTRREYLYVGARWDYR